MLKLETKELDICRLSKVIVKFDVKASIDKNLIVLDGDISDDLLNQLYKDANICNIQNFKDEVAKTNISYSKKNNDKLNSEKEKNEIMHIPQLTEEYDLLYPKVKRGEVYYCDFGEPFGSEIGYKRYAIVVQNDNENLYSSTTIVLACTTKPKKNMPVHYSFSFSNENMLDYDTYRVGTKPNIILAEQIRTVDKKRLRKYLGTMKPEFMENLQDIMDSALYLKREKVAYNKIKKVSHDEVKNYKDLNVVQIQLLSKVDINNLLQIAESSNTDKEKAEQILKLFGFDLNTKGVEYLLKAILISPKNEYFNLETLSEKIAEQEANIEKEEVKRLIVARVKERFKFKKSPTIDFIRVVNSFLSKRSNEDEKTNI